MLRGAMAAALVAVLGVCGLVLAFVVIGSTTSETGTPAGTTCAPAGWTPGRPIGEFGPRELTNAATIVQVGVDLGVPLQGQVIAVATGMQESHLLVLGNPAIPASMQPPPQGVGTDHDSLGLFQQRLGWGPVPVRMDPRGSAQLFYRHLLRIPNWEDLPLTQAADAVQVSAFPTAYARWETLARQVVGAVSGLACPTTTAGPLSAPDQTAAGTAVQRALTQVGTPYVWGGGGPHGPTAGALGGRAPRGGGFDCSGLMVFAFAGIGVSVPHQTQAIWSAFAPPITDPAAVQPGDMVLFSSTGQPGGIHHVGLYLGAGNLVHAPETGQNVEVVANIWETPYWKTQFIGAVRAGGGGATPDR